MNAWHERGFRTLMALAWLAALGCANSTADLSVASEQTLEPPPSGAASEPRLIRACRAAGAITNTTTRADLDGLFPGVPLKDRSNSDGRDSSISFQTIVGSKLDSITVTWTDADRVRVSNVSNWGASWRTDVGLRPGLDVDEALAILGEFRFIGWGTDDEGRALLHTRPAPFGCFTLRFGSAPCDSSKDDCAKYLGGSFSTEDLGARRTLGVIEWVEMGIWDGEALPPASKAESEGQIQTKKDESAKRLATEQWQLVFNEFKQAKQMWETAASSGDLDLRVVAAFELTSRAEAVVDASRSLLEEVEGEQRSVAKRALDGAIASATEIRAERDNLARSAGLLAPSQSSSIRASARFRCSNYLKCQADFCSAESRAKLGTPGPIGLYVPEACHRVREHQVRLTNGFKEEECERADAIFRLSAPTLIRLGSQTGSAWAVPTSCQ